MRTRSQISLCKYFLRYPLESYPKPTSSFLINSLSAIPTQLVPSSVRCPKPNLFQHPIHQISLKYGTDSAAPELDVNKEVDSINLKFAEAREEIEMAMESKETVYFNEEAECARAAVKEVLDMFEGLSGKLPESKKAALQRSMGLKIEQLKAELQQLDD
ncbi:hypothetical protein F3Y22_tig00110198pilonHSYRG00114 [Hibiscus syriacus]|uniref:Uncharacterized protein n=1 Tax=Hibiscus syriacus TaxID=106335 RepID=A0A6A3BGZ5_HIBSY|nr:uncharacterized protein LOC120218442 [Hibiscus syriacus]KAE8714282.1 hypothetical protein F3Y22_tig00110198pilonHSYRG00114 [Hibiscus syriacus]